MQNFWATKSHIGNRREENQDFLAADGQLFVVADGMGGHRGGAEAAKLATETFCKYLADLPSETELTKNEMSAAIKEANKNVYQKAQNDSELFGMGTTLCVLYIGKEKIIVGNVGDSRLYEFDSKLNQMTEDHNAAWEYRRNGGDEELIGRLSYQLTRAIGTSQEVESDVWEFPLNQEKYFLLCSDGLNGEISDGEITKHLNPLKNIKPETKDLEMVCDNLIEAALAAGGNDNISVVLVFTGSES